MKRGSIHVGAGARSGERNGRHMVVAAVMGVALGLLVVGCPAGGPDDEGGSDTAPAAGSGGDPVGLGGEAGGVPDVPPGAGPADAPIPEPSGPGQDDDPGQDRGETPRADSAGEPRAASDPDPAVPQTEQTEDAEPADGPLGDWQVHPAGFAFQVPAAWRWQLDADGSRLLPPGVSASSEVESHVIQALPELVDPRDPTVAAALTQELASLGVPADASPQTLDFVGREGAGRRFTWNYTHKTLNKPLSVSMFLVATAAPTVALLSVGEPAPIAARAAALLAVAQSAEARMPAPAPVSALSDGAPASEQWLQQLRGMQLTLIDSDYDASSGYAMRTRIVLSVDGRFALSSYSSTSVGAGDGGAHVGGTGGTTGRWRIATEQGQSYLVLLQDGVPGEQWNALRSDSGETYLNGRRAYVTAPGE